MSIRQLLAQAHDGPTDDVTNMFDNTYIEQSLTVGGNVLGGGDSIKITYIKRQGTVPGFFSAVSTTFTQQDQPYIPKHTDSYDNTADVVTSKALGGGFKIEDRPLIGSDDTTTP